MVKNRTTDGICINCNLRIYFQQKENRWEHYSLFGCKKPMDSIGVNKE